MDRCSSREVGAALARQILSMVNQEQPTSDDLPVFNHAKSVRATLPNDFHFIHYDVPHLPGNGVSARYKKSLVCAIRKHRLSVADCFRPGYSFRNKTQWQLDAHAGRQKRPSHFHHILRSCPGHSQQLDGAVRSS